MKRPFLRNRCFIAIDPELVIKIFVDVFLRHAKFPPLGFDVYSG
jgi:hypothetical protein